MSGTQKGHGRFSQFLEGVVVGHLNVWWSFLYHGHDQTFRFQRADAMSLQPAKTTTFTTLMPLQPSQATCSSTSLAHIAMCWIYHCSSVANRDSIRECGLRPNVARVLALKDHRSLLMVMDSCCIFVQLWTSCNPHAKEYSWIQLLLPRPRSFIRLLRVH